MTGKSPLVSIIVPTYNRAGLISESLNSILAQNFLDWECIIVDDHSTDKTMQVIKTYLNKDSRFRFYTRPAEMKKGANSCRNYGLEKASGNYIHWFDSDDISHPEYLSISLRLIQQHNVDFCRFSRAVFTGKFQKSFEEQENEILVEFIDHHHIEKLIKNELSFNTCNVVWKKTSLGSERFSEEIVYGDEWEFYPRLLSVGLQGVSIDNVLFFGRKHENSTTSEFWNNDPERRASKVKAVKLVIENLEKKNLLTPSLVKYFIQMGFFLKEPSIIEFTLEKSNSGILKKFKYRIGYSFYPVVRPFLKLKGSLKNLGK